MSAGWGMPKNVQDRRSNICQYTIFHFSILILCYIYKWNRVQRVSRIRCTIFIQCMVGITVVGNNDYFIIISLAASTVSFTHSSIALHCFFNSVIDTCMTYHITISVIYDNEIDFWVLMASTNLSFTS